MAKYRINSCEVQVSWVEKSASVLPPKRVVPPSLCDEYIKEIAADVDILAACDALPKSASFDEASDMAAAGTARGRLNVLLAQNLTGITKPAIVMDSSKPTYRPRGNYHEVIGWVMRDKGSGQPLPVAYTITSGNQKCVVYGCFRIVIQKILASGSGSAKGSKTTSHHRRSNKKKG